MPWISHSEYAHAVLQLVICVSDVSTKCGDKCRVTGCDSFSKGSLARLRTAIPLMCEEKNAATVQT